MRQEDAVAGGWGGDSMQGYVERQIREAQDRGDFDDLPTDQRG